MARVAVSARRNLSWCVGWLFAAALLLWIHYRLGWDAVFDPWRRLPLPQLALAVALILSTYVVRSLRQSAYFPERMAGRFWLSTRLMVWHNFYNNLLPLRAGELSFPLLARRYFRVDYAEATGALIWFRLLDLWAIALIGLTAAALARTIWLLPLLLLLPLPAFIARLSQALTPRLSSTRAVWANGVRRIVAALPHEPARLWSSCAWTLANWIVKLTAFAWLLTVFAPLPYPAALIGAIGGDLTTVLPIHAPAGLGSYEAGVAAAVLPFGISPEQAIPAAVSLHMVILASTLVAALITALIPLPERETDDRP